MPILRREGNTASISRHVPATISNRSGTDTPDVAPSGEQDDLWSTGRLLFAARASAAAVGVTSVAFLLGWYAQVPSMVRLRPDFAPVLFNTALCFLLAAGALVALTEQRSRVAIALATTILLITGTTLLQYLTPWPFGVDELMWHVGVSRQAMTPFTDAARGTSGRMAPNSALGCMLLALGLLTIAAGRMNRSRLVVGGFCAVVAASVGAVSLSGYLIGIPTAYGWGSFNRMAPQSTVILIAMGFGLLCATALVARRNGVYLGRVVPGLAASATALIAIFMWEALVDHDRRNLETAALHQARAVASAVVRGIENRARIVDRLVLERALVPEGPSGARSQAAAQIFRDFSGITAITWLDSTGIVTWRMAEHGDATDPVGTNFRRIPSREALLRGSRDRNRAVVSAPLLHLEREPSVFIAAPVLGKDDATAGYLVFEIVPERLLAEALPLDFAALYRYSLTDARRPLVGRSGSDQGDLEDAVTVGIDARDRQWKLTVAPTDRTLAEFSSALPLIFLLTGLLCAALAARIVRSAQVAAEQSRKLARTVADLAAQNEARREAEILREDQSDMLQVQAVELEIQYSELQTTAKELAHQRDSLDSAQKFSAALVRSTVDAVAAFDRDGHVHDWNPAMASLTGRALDDLGDAVVGRLLPFLAAGEEVRLLQDALAGRSTTLPALHASHENTHTEVWLDLTITPMRSADGQVVGGLLVARDVTEQHRVAEVILASKEAAEASNRSKSDFLARMSHELRTPLNAVIGFTNVIRRNADNHLRKADLTYLDRIAANGKHLLALIDTVLDISKIESGRESVELAVTAVSTLVRDTIAELDVRATESGLHLHIATPWGAQATTDESKLKQVLINLIGNAIKFTPRDGQIFVRVETDPFTGTATRIDVEDTGIGIPHDRLGAIFEAFEQADSQTAHTYGGTGLGLAISRKLCMLMGHELIVESEPGKGSKFSILFSPPAVSAGVASVR